VHDLLDVLHAHGEMEPIQDVFDRAARGRAHQRRQGGVAVADRGDRVAFPPALTLQRRAQQCVRLLGHAAHQGEAPGGVALILHLAADRLEVANLMAGYGTYVGAIEHDDGPALSGDMQNPSSGDTRNPATLPSRGEMECMTR